MSNERIEKWIEACEDPAGKAALQELLHLRESERERAKLFESVNAHVMLDIETLGTLPDSAVTAIAAMQFNPYAGDPGYDRALNWNPWCTGIDLFDSLMQGLVIYEETVKFWRKVDPEVRDFQRQVMRNAPPLREALLSFNAFITDVKRTTDMPVVVWSKSPQFDAAILRNAYRAVDLEPAWGFRNDEDVRALYRLGKINELDDVPDMLKRKWRKHAVTSDVCQQAYLVSLAFSRLR